MKHYNFIITKHNTKSVNNVFEFIFEEYNKNIPFIIYNEKQTIDRIIPKGLISIYNNGIDIINEKIEYNIEFNPSSSNNFTGYIIPEHEYPYDFHFFVGKIEKVYKINGFTGGYFIIFEEKNAILISKGSGMRYVGCVVGKIIENNNM